MTQNRDRKEQIRARMAATSEPYTVAARAISSRFAETVDDFLADRRADLDAGEDGAGMTDADYYDRISTSTEPITYCAECGQATDGRCVFVTAASALTAPSAGTSAPDWTAEP